MSHVAVLFVLPSTGVHVLYTFVIQLEQYPVVMNMVWEVDMFILKMSHVLVLSLILVIVTSTLFFP